MLHVNDQIQIPDRELQFAFARSGGPGGQNVNKVNSRATLSWDVLTTSSLPEDVRIRLLTRYRRRVSREGILQITGQRYRDQTRNIEDCRRRLVELILTVATAPEIRRPTRPSRGAKQRRLSDKKVRSDRKVSRKPPSVND